MKKLLNTVLLSSISLSLLAGCATTQVTRTQTDQVTDLSGRWNDTDARLVATALAADLMTGAWLERFQQAHPAQNLPSGYYSKPKPVIIVGTVLNKSHEHIEADTFIKDIEKAVIEQGEIRIVANSTLRNKLRQEKGEQAGFVSPETQKHFGRELGADYMIFGTINTIVDTEGKNKVVFYQVNLELVHLETNEKVWIGEKKIKKYIGGKKIDKKYQGALPQ
ncbi:MAG: penicillin-binding protein activator LpoB [Roseivirga sp.]